MTEFQAKGLALWNQPKPEMYFERPLGWGGKFSEIPPALVARFRLK